MKVIDLLNDIYNFNYVPKHIGYKGYTFTFYQTEYRNDDENVDDDSFYSLLSNHSLFSEIEVIGDEVDKLR